MLKKIGILILMICAQTSLAQEPFKEQEIAVNPMIDGTLTLPAEGEASSLVILIAGSGPTDRNSNQPMMRNDAFKKTAHELAGNGIATYRFDKRIFKMSEFNIKEEDLRFDDFVEDTEAIINYFKENGAFNNIVVAGHSEGSLIGMLAAKDKADAFISIAGAGRNIDSVIVEQIGKQAPGLQENTRESLDEIIATGSTSNYNPMLASVFRPGVQPYLASWINYNPAEEIAKLNIPVLIIQGTSDIQVETKEAEILKEAKPDAKLVLLQDMNHVFRKVEEEDRLANTKTYNEPQRPLHPNFIPAITAFIKSLEQK